MTGIARSSEQHRQDRCADEQAYADREKLVVASLALPEQSFRLFLECAARGVGFFFRVHLMAPFRIAPDRPLHDFVGAAIRGCVIHKMQLRTRAASSIDIFSSSDAARSAWEIFFGTFPKKLGSLMGRSPTTVGELQ